MNSFRETCQARYLPGEAPATFTSRTMCCSCRKNPADDQNADWKIYSYDTATKEIPRSDIGVI